MHIGILVCTADRPQMLHRCLSSLCSLAIDPDWQVEIVIVENDANPQSQPIVDQLSQTAPFPLHYVQEPRRGIPFARNRSLAEALERKYDWVLQIDDDEVADPNWLRAHLTAAKTHNADVTYGEIIKDYEQEPPSWWPHGYVAPPAEGTVLTRASTCNAAFSTVLIDPARGALDFNPVFCYGYEDLDFFERAHALGYKIVSAPHARVTEFVPASRVSPKRLAAFARSSAAAHVQVGILRKGFRPSALKFTLKGIRRVISAAVLIGLFYPGYKFGHGPSHNRYFKAQMRMARGMGNLQGVFGRPSNFYGVIDGH